MGLLQTLQDEMKTAMKAGDPAKRDALRLLISSIKYAEVDSPNMSDEQIIQVLQKEAKKRREAVEAYKAGGRPEAAEKEAYELSLIETYLPKMMSEDEVRAKLTANSIQLTAAANFGEAMKIAMKAVVGQADGGVVSKIVKELFH